MESSICQVQVSMPSVSKISKKYSKVNEDLKKEFLSLIILHNKSIKQASEALNINYSSAKAILAAHKKARQSSKKIINNGIRAAYRQITPCSTILGEFRVTSSIGGCQISSFEQFDQPKLFYKTSIAPVILLKGVKEVESSEQTEHRSTI